MVWLGGQNYKRRKLLPTCLSSLLLASSSILLLAHSCTNIRSNSFGILMYTEDSRNTTGLQHRLGLQRNPASWTEHLPDSQSLQCIAGLSGGYPINQSNESINSPPTSFQAVIGTTRYPQGYHVSRDPVDSKL